MKKWCLWMVLAAALQVTAGVSFTAVTTTTTDGRKPEKTTVEVSVEGPNARIDFSQSANPMAKKGTYLVTRDAGTTMFLVNPEDKTYTRWNMAQLSAMVGGMGDMFKLTFSDPKVEKLEESNGGKVMGYDTRRYKFKTSYDMEMKAMGMKNFQSIESVQESWTTTAISDKGMYAWLRNWAATGNEELDKLVKESMSAVQGFPLRTKTHSTTRQYNRKRTKVKNTTQSVSEMEVTRLEKAAVKDDVFSWPDDYKEVDLTGGNGNGVPSFKDLFKRNN